CFRPRAAVRHPDAFGQRFSLCDPANTGDLHSQARGSGRQRERPLRRGQPWYREDQGQSDLSAERGPTGPSRSRGPEDHGLDHPAALTKPPIKETTMLKIFGRANSINVRKVLWTADEIGIPYTREDWGRGFRPTNDPEFLKINPFGVVPA